MGTNHTSLENYQAAALLVLVLVYSVSSATVTCFWEQGLRWWEEKAKHLNPDLRAMARNGSRCVGPPFTDMMCPFLFSPPKEERAAGLTDQPSVLC